jgi:hypothetical protein
MPHLTPHRPVKQPVTPANCPEAAILSILSILSRGVQLFGCDNRGSKAQ